MARRHNRKLLATTQTQDPGKDLFAYLFLVMMIFSFMMMMTMEERLEKVHSQPTPQQKQAAVGKTALARVSGEQVGKLVLMNGNLLLVFGENSYDPHTDVNKLIDDGHVVSSKKESGLESKIIYLENGKDSRILLDQYLEAFTSLNNAGVNVAFAKKVN